MFVGDLLLWEKRVYVCGLRKFTFVGGFTLVGGFTFVGKRGLRLWGRFTFMGVLRLRALHPYCSKTNHSRDGEEK